MPDEYGLFFNSATSHPQMTLDNPYIFHNDVIDGCGTIMKLNKSQLSSNALYTFDITAMNTGGTITIVQDVKLSKSL